MDEKDDKPLSQTVDDVRNAIEDCDLPIGSHERFEFMKQQLDKLVEGITWGT
jgi:hypothetical protein